MKLEVFIRVPFEVEGVQVTAENMQEVAAWCQGTIVTVGEDVPYIQVRTHHPMNDRQTQAHIEDWVLLANMGFKVYTPSAFERYFQPAPKQEKVSVRPTFRSSTGVTPLRVFGDKNNS